MTRLRSRPSTPLTTGTAAFAAICLLAIVSTAASTASTAAPACDPPPPAIRDIALPRFYGDKAGTKIDPNLKAAHRAAVAPLKDFVARIAKDADKSWQRRNPKDKTAFGTCTVTWLATWARDTALLGRMDTKQAEYQRKWDMTGLALAYLKVRAYAAPADRKDIDAWLINLANASRAFFNNPRRKRNNHWYWLGLGVGAVALATDSQPHWRMAREIFADAMRDIAPDGTMPHELARKSRALHYHDFAAMPLVVLAELAASRGEDWTTGPGDGLHRLVRMTLAGHADPSVFERIAGEPQVQPVRPPAGWLSLYAARFPKRVPAILPYAKTGHRWLGGDARVLAEALQAMSKR